MQLGVALRNWQDLQKGCSDPHLLLLHCFLSGGGWGKMWGRLVAAAWQAKLSKDLDHLLLLAAAAEVAVGRSEGDPGVSEGGQGKGNPDLLHHHLGDHPDQGLLEVGDLHQTEAGGMEAAVVVAAAAVAVVF